VLGVSPCDLGNDLKLRFEQRSSFLFDSSEFCLLAALFFSRESSITDCNVNLNVPYF
jgi:hypothetical protein